MINPFLLVALGILLHFCYIDIKEKSVPNQSIALLAVIMMAYRLSIHELSWVLLLGSLSFFILGFILWDRKAIGGADAKILPVIVGLLPYHGFGSLIGVLFNFLLIFMVVGIIYAFFYTRITKEQEIPFIPAITLTIILTYIVYI